MMKGFVKFSKLMGLMLIASGLLFAGCAQDGSSTDKLVSGHDGFMIPITMDMATQTMAIGDGSGAATTGTWAGHNVRLANVGSCGGSATAATCTIRVTNLDPDYYMANVYIALSYCADCAGDKFFSDADLSNGVTVFVSGSQTGAGGMADINGAAFCVVEDGIYDTSPVPYPSPYNPTGCATVNTMGNRKPLQFIHPDCGSRDVDWNFSTATGTNFRFYANIAADWFPEDPTGDARFDFENKTTYYLTLNALNDAIPAATYKAWWKIGSSQRSSVLTGYGSGGADFSPVDPDVSGTRVYFALNVQGEYPDRIERYTGVGHTDGHGFSDYEYYVSWGLIIRYDPTVVSLSTGGVTVKGGTSIPAGGQDQCNDASGYCNVPYTPTYNGFDGIVSPTVSNVADGYIYTYNAITVANFQWNQATVNYKTTNGGSINAGYYTTGVIPLAVGHVGLAKISLVPSPGYTNTVWYNSTAVITSGTPDPDPEIGLGMFYFRLLRGTQGMGTQFYADMWTTENAPQLAWTNGTAAGGVGGGTDDWLQPCFPIQAGYEANGGCNDSMPASSYWVFHGLEVSNQNIHHSGYTVTGGGASQYWNVHLCVL